jgi:hypothetical protein
MKLKQIGEILIRLLGWILILFSLGLYLFDINGNSFSGFSLLLLFWGGFFARFRPPLQGDFHLNFKRVRNFLLVFFVLFFLTFFYQYWFYQDFGFYENDYETVAPVLDWDWNGLFTSIFERLHTQFSPQSFSIVTVQLFSFFGYQAAGLQGVYLLSCCVLSMISVTIFYLIRKLFKHTLIALIGAILFIVFPSVMFPQLLFIVFSKQMGLLFFLLSLTFFLHKRQLGFTLFMLLALFLAREYAVLFLILPLFSLSRSLTFRPSNYAKHSLGVIALFCAVVVIQYWGEPNFNLVNDVFYLFLFPVRPVKDFFNGVYYFSLKNFAQNPTALIQHFSPLLLFAFALIPLLLTVFYWIMQRKTPPRRKLARRHYAMHTSILSIEFSLSPIALRALIFLFIGFLMWMYAYSGFPGVVYVGGIHTTNSWTNLVSVFPITLVFCGSFAFLFFAVRKRFLKTLLLFLTVGYLGLLGAHRLQVQQNIAQGWERQQWLWSNSIAELPALDPDLNIEINVLSKRMLHAFDDGSSLVMSCDLLPYLFEKPDRWDNYPALEFTYGIKPNYQDERDGAASTVLLELHNGRLSLDPDSVGDSAVLDVSTRISVESLEKKALFPFVYNEDLVGIPLPELMEAGQASNE